MKFRPCIDIHNGVVKQIVGSTLDLKTDLKENFISNYPAQYYSQMFKKDNLFGGHICLLGVGCFLPALGAVNTFKGGLQVGGGMNDKNCQEFLENGASEIIVTSFIFENGEINFKNIDKMNSSIGKDKCVFDLSCKKDENGRFFVTTNRWTQISDFEVTHKNLAVLDGYCKEFLIHSTDVEGKKNGIDTDLIKILAQYSNIKSGESTNYKNTVTYAGGISSFDDVEEIKKLSDGKIDFSIGSSLDIFGGHLKYKEAVEKYR